MFILKIFLLALLSGVAQYFYPWWAMSLVAFAFGIIFGKSTFRVFFAGFLGVGLLWFCYALYLSIVNEGILANRIGMLFGLEGLIDVSWLSSGFLLVLLTAFLGGTVAALSCLSGSLFRKIFVR